MKLWRYVCDDVGALGLILAVAALAGALWNPRQVLNLPTEVGRKSTAHVVSSMQVKVVTLETVLASKSTGAILLDARPGIFFENGHIPGAWSLPKDDFAARFAELKLLLDGAAGKQIIVYCTGGDCADSGYVAGRLQAAGLVNLAIYEGGWEEWVVAGQPEERGKGTPIK